MRPFTKNMKFYEVGGGGGQEDVLSSPTPLPKCGKNDLVCAQ